MSISYLLQTVRASQLLQLVKNLPASAGNQEAQVWSLGWEDSWRRKWQPTPVFLPWEIPWTEEPGGLQSVGSQKSGHNCAHTHTHTQTVMCRQDTQTVSAVISTQVATFWSLWIYWLLLLCALVLLFGLLQNLHMCTECLYATKHKRNRWRLHIVTLLI